MAEQFILPRGDQWLRRDGTNKDLLEAFWEELIRLHPDLAAKMAALLSATGFYLDEHGLMYGVRRRNDEGDQAYRARIITSILRPRSTVEAMQQTVTQAFGSSVEVRNFIDELRAVGSPMIDGTRNIDGTWFIEIKVDPEHAQPGYFFVTPEDRTRLADIVELIELTRAAGYIPVYRALLRFDDDLNNPNEAFYKFDVPFINGRPIVPPGHPDAWDIRTAHKPTEVILGDGGVDENGEPLPFDFGNFDIQNEVHRQPVISDLANYRHHYVHTEVKAQIAFNEIMLIDARNQRFYTTIKTITIPKNGSVRMEWYFSDYMVIMVDGQPVTVF
jgi:hypothetical protein